MADGTVADILDELRQIRSTLEAGPVEGLNAQAAATLAGVSRSKWHGLVSRGLAPQPVNLDVDGCRRWLRSELVAWLRSGAPARSKWRLMREVAMRRIA
jgi:predicted DNA-binding transcriptional regulator AlpA